MKTFDEKMRAQTHKERWTASPEAQVRMQQAIRSGQYQSAQNRHKPRRYKSALAGVLAAAAVATAMLAIRPPSDAHTGNWMQQSGFVLADGETPVPVTVPDVKLSAVIRDQELIAEAAFINQTADIWILHWEAGLVGEGVQTAAPTPLIWLEAGVAFTDEAAWSLNGTQSSSLDWYCAAYRVTADILQWLDEEHLSPGEEGYERQQELLQAAYEAGALIIAAGNWPAGSAGEIRLILPDNCEKTDVLSHYVTIGALEDPKTQSSTLTAK